MLLRYLFVNKYLAILTVFLTVIITKASVASIFFNASKEIIYDYDLGLFLCLDENAICVYSGTLLIANTGDAVLSEVAVVNRPLLKGLTYAFKILNLNASQPREGDPVIETLGEVHTLKQVYPGTLIEIKYSGSIPLAEKDPLSNFSPMVSADAKLINADPHGTEIVRLLSLFW